MTANLFEDAYKAYLSTIKNMGNCLDTALSSSGKTKEELATFLDVDRATISRISKGRSALTLEQVADICDFLGNDLLADYVIFSLLSRRKLRIAK